MQRKCNHCGCSLKEAEFCPDCTLADISADELLNLISAAKKDKNCPQLLDSATGKLYEIAVDKFKIGRDPSAQVVIETDPYISRFHAWITRDGGDYFLEDLGSTNGTLHNGEPVFRRRRLINGDQLRIGRSDFVFVKDSSTASKSLSSKSKPKSRLET